MAQSPRNYQTKTRPANCIAGVEVPVERGMSRATLVAPNTTAKIVLKEGERQTVKPAAASFVSQPSILLLFSFKIPHHANYPKPFNRYIMTFIARFGVNLQPPILSNLEPDL